MRVKAIKELRDKYDPRRRGLKIRILFIGESPPPEAPQIFFYNRTSILYYATFLAFHKVFGVREDSFLEFFRDLGCYLYDLFEEPGKIIQGKEGEGRVRASRDEVEKAKRELEKFIQDVRPEIVIVVIKRVSRRIKRLLERLKVQGVIRDYFDLPFPRGANNFIDYVDGLYSSLIKYFKLS